MAAFQKGFGSYVCAGDWIDGEADGFTVRATVYRDDNADRPDQMSEGFWPSRDPNDAGYTPNYWPEFYRAQEAMRAWQADEWFYCGIAVTVFKDDVCLSTPYEHALWAIEANYPGSDNAYLLEVANDLVEDAIAAAKEKTAELDCDVLAAAIRNCAANMIESMRDAYQAGDAHYADAAVRLIRDQLGYDAEAIFAEARAKTIGHYDIEQPGGCGAARNPLARDFPKRAHGMRLLTPAQAKMDKSRARGFWTFVLHFAPHKLSGFNVCPKASAGCIAACLNLSGRAEMTVGGRVTLAGIKSGRRTNTIHRARLRRTRAFMANRGEFMALLVADIERACDEAGKAGLEACFRLNGTSDIRWERVPCMRGGVVFDNVMSAFPSVMFYDYTKIENRRGLPANYRLTFSLNENNGKAAARLLASGMNVAAVYRTKALALLEAGKPGRVDGDQDDLRFLDPEGVIVALSAKGRLAKRDRSGFVLG
jgi:hypothetical protein